jgi:ABC-type uncharacterized transport system auxiliary subunit
MNILTTIRRDTQRIAMLLIAATLLSACSLATGTRGEVAVYTLDADGAPYESGAAASAPRPLQLVVATPAASGPLGGNHITVRPGGGEVGVLAEARWAADLPDLLRGFLVTRLTRGGRYAAVVADAEGAHGDLLVSIDLEHFEVLRGSGADEVRVSWTAKLIRPDNGRVLAVRVSDHRAAVDGHGAAAVVATLTRLAGKAADEVQEAGLGVEPRPSG